MDLYYVESYFWEFRNRDGNPTSSRYVIRSVGEAQQLLESYNSSFLISYQAKLVNVDEFSEYVAKKELEFVIIARR